jgi:hypothetical protein
LAAKKTPAPKRSTPTKKPAAKKASVAQNGGKKTAAAPKLKETTASKLLPTLPPLNDLRRRTYGGFFTAEQCKAWGAKTKAAAVLADADKAVGTLAPAVLKGIDGYAAARFSWLANLVVELADAVEHQQAAASEGADTRSNRTAAVAVANRTRLKLAHGLVAAAGSNHDLLKLVASRNDSNVSPGALETSITGLLQLAVALRRTPEGALLAGDAGLTEAFLSSASAIADSLHSSNAATWLAGREQDTEETNLIEGRVLRELNYLRVALNRAKERGASVPTFPTLTSMKAFLHKDGSTAEPETPPETPPA